MEPGTGASRHGRSFTTRHAERRAALASQPWPAFFRGLAVRTAVIAALVCAAVLLVWLLAR